MAAPMQVVLLSLGDKFPSLNINPLHALADRKSFNVLFMNNNTSSSSSSHLLLFSSSGSQSKRSIFICVHLRSSDEDEDDDEGALRLHTSQLFLRHHRIANQSRGTARLVPPPLPSPSSLEMSGVVSLQKVVLGAGSRHTLRWATSEHFSRLLQVLLSSSWVLAREGDPLLLPCTPPPPPHNLLGEDPSPFQEYLQDLLVMECRPVRQGVLTVDTVVVVTDRWDACEDPPPPLPSSSSSRPMTSPSSSSSSVCAAVTSSVFVSDFAHFANGIGDADGGGGVTLLENKALMEAGFSGFLGALECQVEVQVLTRCLDGDRRLDGDSCVFVSKQLLLRLGLFNREWVLLLGWTQRPAQVVVAKHGGEDLGLPCQREDVAFISSTLWFNLTNGRQLPVNNTSLKMKRWKPGCLQSGGSPRRSDSECLSVRPPVSSELHIQPVLCPHCKQHGCYDDLLQRHFTVPRLVSEGDILTVPAQHCPDLLHHNTDGINRCSAVHFRVQKVVGSHEEEQKVVGSHEEEQKVVGSHEEEQKVVGSHEEEQKVVGSHEEEQKVVGSHEEEQSRAAFLADRQHTTLYMGASTNSRSPWCCVDEDASLFFNGACPAGLTSTVDTLTSVITPHLTHSGVCVCTVLLQGPRGGGKTTAVRAACRRLHLHVVKVDCVSVCGETAAACEVRLRSLFQRAVNHRPCVLLLRNLRLLAPPGVQDGPPGDSRVWGTLCELITNVPHSVVVIATVCSPRDLCPDVMQVFVHQVSLFAPGEEERRGMLESLSQPLPLGRDVSLSLLAKQTAGFVLGDLCGLLTEAGRAAHRRLCVSVVCSLEQEELLCSSGVSVHMEDFSSALDSLQVALSSAVGAPKVPSVHWEDVGGLQEVKKEIVDTVRLPLDRPELFSSSLGLRRTGLLLYGPPGTGKTLLAKAVATETNMTFLSVKGPELLNMYVGQSEENVREVFSKARAAAPCIVFFDELDSLAPNRGRSGDSGGVMDRVVSQLLAELDSLGSCEGLFVIGATNRPDLLDQSLLRPGRFDKLVYVGINEDKQSQLQVLKAISRKFQCDASVNLEEVVSRCPAHLTGADLYALCSDAMATAVNRKISSIVNGMDTEESPVVLTGEDFDRAVQQCKPSVSDQELLRYQHLHHSLTTA